MEMFVGREALLRNTETAGTGKWEMREHTEWDRGSQDGGHGSNMAPVSCGSDTRRNAETGTE